MVGELQNHYREKNKHILPDNWQTMVLEKMKDKVIFDPSLEWNTKWKKVSIDRDCDVCIASYDG